MSNQICLKWNSFLNNIATSFESLWEEEGLVDVTLASDGQCLTAHKVILSASSPFFKKVFQTNPCQHPVIILQDVHFRELEALLIFIYKGEVNIEQQNLSALLKAAETLKIRGLSGGDMFAKDSYKRFVDIDNTDIVGDVGVGGGGGGDVMIGKNDDIPKKRQKISVKKQNKDSILEKALNPRLIRNDCTDDSSGTINNVDENFKDTDVVSQDSVLMRLEMKTEPIEIDVDDFRKSTIEIRKDSSERPDTGQNDSLQGGSSSKPIVTVIPEARDTSSPSISDPRVFAGGSDYTILKNSPFKNDNDKDEDEDEDEDEASISLSTNEPLNFPSDTDPSISQPVFPPNINATNSSIDRCQTNNEKKTDEDSEENLKAGGSSFPPFPCPFCDRAYTSWGFRRRHIKAVHTVSPMLNCKWCLQVLPNHAAWRRHVISSHNLSASDAHNGLLILEEAHMVLQIVNPTRLETLVNIIKRNSKRNENEYRIEGKNDKETGNKEGND